MSHDCLLQCKVALGMTTQQQSLSLSHTRHCHPRSSLLAIGLHLLAIQFLEELKHTGPHPPPPLGSNHAALHDWVYCMVPSILRHQCNREYWGIQRNTRNLISHPESTMPLLAQKQFILGRLWWRWVMSQVKENGGYFGEIWGYSTSMASSSIPISRFP